MNQKLQEGGEPVMRINVTLGANAGIAVEAAGCRIWVDALHEQKVPGFSAVTPALQKKMLSCGAFFSPDAICYTHCHPDHYSRRLTLAALRLWPMAKIIAPEPEFADQILITGENTEVPLENASLRFLSLPHEGAQYADVKHYGILFSAEGHNVLFAGDCATASPALAEAIGGIPVDLAILDFPWITLRRGREFLQTSLSARHLLICHLPFEQDDTEGYRENTLQAAKTLAHPDVRLLMEPLQTEIIEI